MASRASGALLLLGAAAALVSQDAGRHAQSRGSLDSGSPVRFVRLNASSWNWNYPVNVFVGTGGNGHTFPGATVPFGMVQATPWCHDLRQQPGGGWDTVSGFHSDSGSSSLRFYGMAHSALSGAGTGELGEVRLRPLGPTGSVQSYLERKASAASPGYFSAKVGSEAGHPDITIESSVTPHGAIHRFEFQRGAAPAVELDLSESPGQYWGYNLGDYILEATSDRQVTGCSSSLITGIGDAESLLCFHIEFDQPFESPGQIGRPKVLLRFPDAAGHQLVARVGLSRTDVPHATKAFADELEGKSFSEVKRGAEAAWNTALGAIEVRIEPLEKKLMFYTALYHTMLFPSLLSDSDGSFRLKSLQRGQKAVPRHAHGKVVKIEDLDKEMPVRHADTQYSTFSLWDTYRSLHPLLNILNPSKSAEFGRSLLAFADIYHDLPPWQLLASPTDMMDGDGGSIVLATMARQGLLDKREVLEAVTRVRLGQTQGEGRHLNSVGYIPAQEEHAASKGLEQAWADSCVRHLASDVGDSATEEQFQKRMAGVFNEWNPKTAFFEPARGGDDQAGPASSEAYTEGTALQYSFGAPFDVQRLAEVHGGFDKFACHLDYFFYQAPVPRSDNPNIEGNIHGMSIGNEPCMHTPYLYSLVGHPARTQAVLDLTVKTLFHQKSHGLPGNDDLGQMSSWLVFTMLGFYPVDPCSNEFVLGRPFVEEARVKVSGGTLSIRVFDQSDGNKYIRRARWLGRDVDMRRPTIPYDELVAGGELQIWMTSEYPGQKPRCDSSSFP